MTTTAGTSLNVRLRSSDDHHEQAAFIEDEVKRKIIRAGRRGGKTTGAAKLAVKKFLDGRRVLYGVPTVDQLERFWFEVKRALAEPLDAGVLTKNETQHFIELPGTEQRIRAKTAWNADTLRGDYADLLILDEWQLMDEEAWEVVGAPMLLDNNGDAVFIYTPPSLRSRSVTKARDPQHAAKLYKKAKKDTSGRWRAYHFPSRANPHISEEGLTEISKDMTALAYRQEIEAEDIDEVPGALWSRLLLEKCRVEEAPELVRIVVAVDPSGGGRSDQGIIVAGLALNGHAYVLADYSCHLSPDGWGRRVVQAYTKYDADRVVWEANYGGDMVKSTVAVAARDMDVEVATKKVEATRGKAVRAEPVSALYGDPERVEESQPRVHHVGSLPELEEQMVTWTQDSGGMADRLDALVWAITELLVKQPTRWGFA